MIFCNRLSPPPPQFNKPQINANQKSHIPFSRLPWDQNTFYGWTVEAVFSVFSAISFLFVYPTFLIFFISICEYQNAFHEIFQSECTAIGRKARAQHCELIDVKAAIRDVVNFHNLAKE